MQSAAVIPALVGTGADICTGSPRAQPVINDVVHIDLPDCLRGVMVVIGIYRLIQITKSAVCTCRAAA